MTKHDLFFLSPFSPLLSPGDLRCGGNYSDPEGFLSLELPGPFTQNRQCIYIINQPPGEKVQINFTQVELESQPGASQCHLEVTHMIHWYFDGIHVGLSIAVGPTAVLSLAVVILQLTRDLLNKCH